jgi:hypothetical protein
MDELGHRHLGSIVVEIEVKGGTVGVAPVSAGRRPAS